MLGAWKRRFRSGGPQKMALTSSWAHLGEVLCRCWLNTTTRQHTTTHKGICFRTSHAKSPFSSSTQCPKVAPRWSQDGPTWLKMAPRWPTIVYRIYLKWRFRMGGVANKCFLACSTTPATTYNYTQHHTPPHDNTQ